MNKSTDASDIDFPEDNIEEAPKKKPTRSRKKPVEKDPAEQVAEAKKVELTAKDKKEINRRMEDVVDDYLENANKSTEAQEKYRKEGKRRFRCMVESTREEFQIFELTMPHPDNPRKPITLRGKCGVIIEEGLTLFAIARLKAAYRVKPGVKKQDPSKNSGLLHAPVRIPNYRVEVYEEIENPLETGKINT